MKFERRVVRQPRMTLNPQPPAQVSRPPVKDAGDLDDDALGAGWRMRKDKWGRYYYYRLDRKDSPTYKRPNVEMDDASEGPSLFAQVKELDDAAELSSYHSFVGGWDLQGLKDDIAVIARRRAAARGSTARVAPPSISETARAEEPMYVIVYGCWGRGHRAEGGSRAADTFRRSNSRAHASSIRCLIEITGMRVDDASALHSLIATVLDRNLLEVRRCCRLCATPAHIFTVNRSPPSAVG